MVDKIKTFFKWCDSGMAGSRLWLEVQHHIADTRFCDIRK